MRNSLYLNAACIDTFCSRTYIQRPHALGDLERRKLKTKKREIVTYYPGCD